MRTSDALAVMENILGSHCNGSSATAVIAVGPVISTLRRVHGSRDLNYSNCIFHSFGSWARSGALERYAMDPAASKGAEVLVEGRAIGQRIGAGAVRVARAGGLRVTSLG